MASTKRQPQLQERDYAFLRGLFESRMMTLTHASQLYFQGREEAAKKRIQKLKANGIVNQRPRQPYTPSILYLTQKALSTLSRSGIIYDYPKLPKSSFQRRTRISELTLTHELSVMDVKVALSGTVTNTRSLNLAEFSTWPLLHQFYASRQTDDALKTDQILVKPDGFIRIGQTDSDHGYREHRFFLELDRSTEPQRVLAERADAYTSFYYTGGFAEWFGRPKEAFKQFPFRVLMILKNAERRNNTAERILLNQRSGLTQIWLTTFDEFTRDPLGSIWTRPADFRDAVQGTAFEPMGGHTTQPYRRQVSRQRYTENTIQKHPLLTAQPAK